MRSDLVPGNPFPDLRLPDHTGAPRRLSLIADNHPLVVAFVRGWWCPKEQIRLRNLVAMQDEIPREYGRIAVITVDSPYVNGAFRAGLGADFPFLSGAARRHRGAGPSGTHRDEDGGRRPGTLTVRSSEYGRILSDGRGFVLYGFTADKKRRSVCFGACAAAWPPYLVKGKPRAGRGVKRSLLGTIRRPGGKRQVTYAGDRSTTTSATEDRDRSSARTCSSSAATGSSSARTGPSFGDGNLTNREEYR